ncbi:Leucine Rich repeats (2 copies) [Anatilimnocola aggregata]|uniref:Leucine Rich repeats (2 copies) n=1 Tax=Anatilimnocola aggregata TaxID=2528021 RepID=A0A517Y585_9BACT|nr:hypothetical protein [Anatilimnocola aggregata]QDU25403.1 Leucine Rich repeats (2 copies) [Anatilimnocola aggregata]
MSVVGETSESSKVAGKPLRLRFSLRALLVATTLFAFALGWFVREYRRYERERVAAAFFAGHPSVSLFNSLSPLGETNNQPVIAIGEVRHGRIYRPIETLFCEGRIEEEFSSHMQLFTNLKNIEIYQGEFSSESNTFDHLPALRELSIKHSDLRDRHLGSIATLPSLRSLQLLKCSISPEGAEKLSTLQNLHNLILTDAPISDVAMERLSTFARLETLDLRNCTFTSDSAVHLGKLSRLKVLVLNSTTADDRLLESADFSRLEVLSLNDCQISDRGLKQVIAGSLRLKYLLLRNTRVTDEGVEQLLDLPWLTHLDLRGTRITRQALATVESLKGRGVVTLANVFQVPP